MKYELTPKDGRKSFYRKAFVEVVNGEEKLISYETPIAIKKDGKIIRIFDGYTSDGEYVGFTATTLRHIKAFCGMNKKEFTALPFKEVN